MPKPPKTFQTLETADAVIRALGGTRAVMTLTSAKSIQVVNNWRYADRFASHTYLILKQALEQAGMTAPATLWGITEPAGESATP